MEIGELLKELKDKFDGLKSTIESQGSLVESLKAEKQKAVQSEQRAQMELTELKGKLKKAQDFFKNMNT
jgi:regulator of replication initiation timing